MAQDLTIDADVKRRGLSLFRFVAGPENLYLVGRDRSEASAIPPLAKLGVARRSVSGISAVTEGSVSRQPTNRQPRRREYGPPPSPVKAGHWLAHHERFGGQREIFTSQAKDMKEPWCLATSLGDEKAGILLKKYGKRWAIECSFRNTKDPHFGMGMGQIRINSPERRDRLWLLNALAVALAPVPAGS